jgi:hypothetical protein
VGQNPYLREIRFIGTIPACAKAIDFHGDGGCRIQVDIPETEKAAALTLAAYFLKKQIEVTIKCQDTGK